MAETTVIMDTKEAKINTSSHKNARLFFVRQGEEGRKMKMKMVAINVKEEVPRSLPNARQLSHAPSQIHDDAPIHAAHRSQPLLSMGGMCMMRGASKI